MKQNNNEAWQLPQDTTVYQPAADHLPEGFLRCGVFLSLTEGKARYPAVPSDAWLTLSFGDVENASILDTDQVHQKLTKPRQNLADDEFDAYRFGEDVTVLAHDNWNTDDPCDYTKIVHMQFNDDAPEAGPREISFHVRFNADGSVEDAYALWEWNAQ